MGRFFLIDFFVSSHSYDSLGLMQSPRLERLRIVAAVTHTVYAPPLTEAQRHSPTAALLRLPALRVLSVTLPPMLHLAGGDRWWILPVLLCGASQLQELTAVLPVRLWQSLLSLSPPGPRRRGSLAALPFDLFRLRSLVPHTPLRRMRVKLLCDASVDAVSNTVAAAALLQRRWGGRGATQFWGTLSVSAAPLEGDDDANQYA